MEMKRYVVFAFETFYPCGGWNDVLSDGMDKNGKLLTRSFDTIEQAQEAADAERIDCDNIHIVNLHTGQIVD